MREQVGHRATPRWPQCTCHPTPPPMPRTSTAHLRASSIRSNRWWCSRAKTYIPELMYMTWLASAAPEDSSALRAAPVAVGRHPLKRAAASGLSWGGVAGEGSVEGGVGVDGEV